MIRQATSCTQANAPSTFYPSAAPQKNLQYPLIPTAIPTLAHNNSQSAIEETLRDVECRHSRELRLGVAFVEISHAYDVKVARAGFISPKLDGKGVAFFEKGVGGGCVVR